MKWFGFCASRKVDQRLTEEEKRKHRCCFTGHRPEKLTKTETEIKDALKHQIDQAIHEGFNVFITGMARGVDLWAAEIVLSLRKKNAEIKLICAIPYDGVDARWPERWRQLYSYVLNQADLVRIIGKCYSYEMFQIRNEWMVLCKASHKTIYEKQMVM